MSSEPRSDGGVARGDRAVAPLVGFVLLLGILVTAFAVYQVTFVPAQNAEVEFEHSQTVAGDLEELRAAMLTTGATQSRVSVPVRLGVQYPSRLVAVNPPPAEGRLRADRATVRIDGAETATRLRGDADRTLLGVDHETRLLAYTPEYAETTFPPVTYLEHSLLFNQEAGANVTLADQRLVQNRSKTLNLVLLEGELDDRGLTGTVDIVRLDGPTGAVPLAASDGDTFELTVPTNAPGAWTSDDSLGTSFEDGEPNVRAERVGPEAVVVTVDDTAGEWDLQVTRLGLGDGDRETALSAIGPFEEPFGPAVDLDMDDQTEDGTDREVGLDGTVTSVGDGANRTGTPIQTIRADIEDTDRQILLDVDPDRSNRTLDLGAAGLAIDTSSLPPGRYNTTIRAQDAAGRWSERDVGTFVLVVTD